MFREEGGNAVHSGMKNLAVYGMRCVLKRNCLVNLEELEERKQNFLLILRCQDQSLIKLLGNMTELIRDP